MLRNPFQRAIGSPRIFELFQPPQALQFSQSISANQNSKWPQQNAVTLAFIHVLIGQRHPTTTLILPQVLYALREKQSFQYFIDLCYYQLQ